MTLAVFLWVYIAFVAGIFLYALLNLFHILRYGRLDAPTYFMTGLFIAGFLFLTFVSSTFISTVDWSTPVTLFISNSFSQ
ncbi:MAG: hypothetical protein HY461_01815 [Parcubacteria group bacterium]|nr:hypothetical protein [Parcubacteria group bacterium]